MNLNEVPIVENKRCKDIVERVNKMMYSQISDKSNQVYRSELNKYLELLVQAHYVLNINGNDLSQLSYNIAISEKVIESAKLYRLIDMNEQIEFYLNELQSLVKDMKQKFTNAKTLMKSESNFQQKIRERIIFYDLKRDEYYSTVGKKENELNHIGFTSKLEHETIAAMKNKNCLLRKDLDLLKERIDFYDFEPNEVSLIVKIAKMKVENEELSNNLNKH